MNRGKIDRILKYDEVAGIFENIEKYDVAIISISSTNPNELKLLRAKLLTERFVISKFNKNISKILKNEFDENETTFLVINIFSHPDFLMFLTELTIEFESLIYIVKKKDNSSLILNTKNKELLTLLDEYTLCELVKIWNEGDFDFEHFHLLQNNSKIIAEFTASQTIAELNGMVTFIKYFSPDGRNEIPNGIYFQKGGFIHECQLNAEKFQIPTAQETQIFITVLPNNFSIEEVIIIDWLKNEFEINKQNEIGFSVGYFFYGKYGDEFDKDSICFEINGIKWKLMIQLNKSFLIQFDIPKALINDFKTGKIFMIKK